MRVQVMKMESKNARASRLALETEDAYSSDRYHSWKAVAMALINEGLTDKEVTAVMRSKWTRWCADNEGKPYGKSTAKCIVPYMKKCCKDFRAECRKMAVETYGEE